MTAKSVAAYYRRGNASKDKGDVDAAIAGFAEAIRYQRNKQGLAYYACKSL